MLYALAQAMMIIQHHSPIQTMGHAQWGAIAARRQWSVSPAPGAPLLSGSTGGPHAQHVLAAGQP